MKIDYSSYRLGHFYFVRGNPLLYCPTDECKRGWLAAQKAYAIDAEMKAKKLSNLEAHLTSRASDGLESPSKKQSSTAGSKSPAKKRKVTSRA